MSILDIVYDKGTVLGKVEGKGTTTSRVVKLITFKNQLFCPKCVGALVPSFL